VNNKIVKESCDLWATMYQNTSILKNLYLGKKISGQNKIDFEVNSTFSLNQPNYSEVIAILAAVT